LIECRIRKKNYSALEECALLNFDESGICFPFDGNLEK
jgi:hypothetical protein